MNVSTLARRMLSSFRQINMTEPHLWYQKARAMAPRRVIVHIGPTNSGKTYSALQALSSASKGIYLGPLRLLAWEVFQKLSSEDIRCGLLTGQEREIPESHTHIACTIEMADLNHEYDVAVIDEGQLIGDQHRGWAWTSAFLGICAHEIHVCGSKTLLPVIQKLCKKTGDDLNVKNYNRLSSLSVLNSSLRSLSEIQPGDCVVGFSRRQLYKMKYKIERKCRNRKIRCCVIYGNLPPEARQAQARLFNDETSEYDVLVASDAIGMGLNLAIKRIVFSTVEKYDGHRIRKLRSQEVKQIAGRAGRYGTKFEDGLVTAMKHHDLYHLRSTMNEEDEDIQTAGLFPTQDQLRLLGIMMDYNVGNDFLSRFQMYEEDIEWGMQASASKSHSKVHGSRDRSNLIGQYGFDVEMIQSKFGGFSNFIRRFEEFLVEEEGVAYVQRVKRIHKKKQRRHKVRLYRFMYDDDDDDSDGDNEDFSNVQGEIDSLDYNDPLCSLAHLYKKIQYAADLDTSGTYFLCNLKENVKLAEILDPLPMTFREKFVFCMAPVDVDNKIMLRTFERFAIDFAHTDEVLINKSQARNIIEMTAKSKEVQDVKFIVKTPEELMKFEIYHKIYDMYRWLGQRFEDQFIDIEMAVECTHCTGYIVGEALSVMGPDKVKRGKENWNGRLSFGGHNGSGYDDDVVDLFDPYDDDDNDDDTRDPTDRDYYVYDDMYSFNRAGKWGGASNVYSRAKSRSSKGKKKMGGKRSKRK